MADYLTSTKPLPRMIIVSFFHFMNFELKLNEPILEIKCLQKGEKFAQALYVISFSSNNEQKGERNTASTVRLQNALKLELADVKSSPNLIFVYRNDMSTTYGATEIFSICPIAFICSVHWYICQYR